MGRVRDDGREMARNADAVSRIDVLILSSLSRIPMHGYELKLELSYKHVGWWAKLEHGHLYAALKRLEKKKFIRGTRTTTQGRERRVFSVTVSGQRWLERALREIATSRDTSYFDVDLFVSATFTLDKKQAVRLLEQRARVMEAQYREARELDQRMRGLVPTSALLIMGHRARHLAAEIEFAQRAAVELAAQKGWGPFLGSESISEFLARTRAPTEENGRVKERPASSRLRRARPRTTRRAKH
jgi:DNA-binding PadR family transcriptional regulator